MKLLEKFAKHDHREGELHHRLGGIGRKFVVDGEPAEVSRAKRKSARQSIVSEAPEIWSGIRQAWELASHVPVGDGVQKVSHSLSPEENVSSSFLARL